MITKPTVLVLGAGASIPYGFPSGQELLKTIHASLDPKSTFWGPLLKDCGIDAAHAEAFRWELYYSQQSSIDTFLEHRPEFLEVGKLAIALSLVPGEDEEWLLRSGGRVEGFYQYLFTKMDTQFELFGANELSIITFNYDRSFEHYLFEALQHSHGRPDGHCASILTAIPVLHVHGSLGKLPWQSPEEESRPYNASFGPEEIRAAAKHILIVSEGQATSQEFQSAFNLLKAAHRVYFLGFGYHDTSLARLRLNELPERLFAGYREGYRSPDRPHMMGTAYGLEYAERQSVSAKWQIVLDDPDSDCLRFLRRYAVLD